MRFRVDLNNLTVEIVPDFGSLPGVGHNGQHYQLPGYALCEWRPSEGEFNLFHPNTEPSSGHVDIRYYPNRRDERYGVEIKPYTHGVEIDFFDPTSVQRHWPTGAWNLFCVIDAIEKSLKKEIGYGPRLAEYIGRTFQQTPELPQSDDH